MLPTIGTVLSVERIRDGGSLCASFVGSDSVQYWLFFKVVIVDVAPGFHEAKEFAPPVVLDGLVGTYVEVSWDHARAMLGEIAGMLRNPSQLDEVEVMLDIARNRGQISPAVRATSESYQGPRPHVSAASMLARA